MRRICISPLTQKLTLGAMVAGIGAGLVRTAPEIQRYLKIRSM